MNILQNIGQMVIPKGKSVAPAAGVAAPPGYNPYLPLMTMPTYRDHLVDISAARMRTDVQTLMVTLAQYDPDVSAAIHAYLTTARSANIVIYAYDKNGNVDTRGIKLASQILAALTTENNYTAFSRKPTQATLLDNIRYMMLLRGAIGLELILDSSYSPDNLRLVDPSTIRWLQPEPGVYVPEQRTLNIGYWVPLTVPTFFWGTYHQNPIDVYSYSPFVAAINTIAARTEVINELYAIMRVVGYPRLDISVLETVLANNAPPALRQDPNLMRDFMQKEIRTISGQINALSADQAFVHSDAIKAEVINDKGSAATLNIDNVINVLDSQNQAALKVMPAVIGKASNATTASVEAQLFAMSADALNEATASILSRILTFATRLAGYAGRIDVSFNPIQLRPALELEPQRVMKAARLQQELSLGTITDIEYHMQVFGRPPPTSAPKLSGTGFIAQNNAAPKDINTDTVNPNDDSLGRSLTPGGSKMVQSNAVKGGSTKAA